MALRPLFQTARIIRFGIEPTGNYAPPSGTYARAYPSLHQPVKIIRFGFAPRGASGVGITFNSAWAVNSNIIMYPGARTS